MKLISLKPAALIRTAGCFYSVVVVAVVSAVSAVSAAIAGTGPRLPDARTTDSINAITFFFIILSPSF